MNHKLCLMVCNKLKQELKTALSAGSDDDVVMRTFPAHCETGIEWEAVRRAVRANNGNNFDRIDVIGGGCLMKLGQPPPDLSHCHLHRRDICFQLFLPQATVDHLIGQGVYLLLPGWLAGWKAQVKHWGFDRETAAEFFNDFANKLLLLDTGVNPNSAAQLQEMSDFVELPAEVIPVGIDSLEFLVTSIVTKWRANLKCAHKVEALAQNSRQAADYALAFDWVSTLPQLGSEEAVVERILEFFTTIFAPDRLVYTAIVNNKPAQSWCFPASNDLVAPPREPVTLPENEYELTEDGRGFLLKLEHQGKAVGVLQVENLSLPEHRQQYLNLALLVAKVCGLVIANTRVLRGILPICANCKKIRDSHDEWHPVDVYIHKHSEIDFTHGICPQCAAELYPEFFKL